MSFTYTAPTIDLDLGIPALGIAARFTPQITLSFGLNFGFGVDVNNGFYFVTDGGTPGNTADDNELHVGALVTLSSVSCPSGMPRYAQISRARAGCDAPANTLRSPGARFMQSIRGHRLPWSGHAVHVGHSVAWS